jgi:hypothetical protein
VNIEGVHLEAWIQWAVKYQPRKVDGSAALRATASTGKNGKVPSDTTKNGYVRMYLFIIVGLGFERHFLV